MSTTTPLTILAPDEALQRLKALPRPWAGDYLVMYSSWLGGVVREPWLMSVPIDDHLVHRGDGVFEAMKCVDGRIYQLDAHLERLARSAQSIHLELPQDLGALRRLIIETTKASGERDVMVRLYVSRGPGGFSTNPFECPQAGLYIVVSRLHLLAEESYQRGVRAGISLVPSKSGFYASVKSCNYLPNVLLKREAVVKGWDFALGLDESGHLSEGSTENVGLVDADNRLLLPLPDHILEGTTVRRVVELAEALVASGLISAIEHRALEQEDLDQAREMMLFGTTLDVLPITRLSGEPVGDGKPGPVATALLALVRQDIATSSAVSVPVFD